TDIFEQLRENCYQKFGNLYEDLRNKPAIEPHEIVSHDRVISRGSLAYFQAQQQAAGATI
ncbi:MAG: phenylalanine 4-monooxygenase, partial [Rhodospirillaceae bacterium]|nr:phenylalanine 4-monooxygenase [Rhodospirillaceae bacterium]